MGCFQSDTKPRAQGIYGFAKADEADAALRMALDKGAGDQALVQKLELHFSCTNLKNVDIGSLTDSACVLYCKDPKYASSTR